MVNYNGIIVLMDDDKRYFRVFSLRLPDHVYDALKARSRHTGMSMNSVTLDLIAHGRKTKKLINKFMERIYKVAAEETARDHLEKTKEFDKPMGLEHMTIGLEESKDTAEEGEG